MTDSDPRPRRSGPRDRALALGALTVALLSVTRGTAAGPQPATPGLPGDLRLFVESGAPGALRSATVYADGVVLWGGVRQLRVSPAEVDLLLRIFGDAGFDAMPEPGFGSGRKWLARRASLRRHGKTKEVAQLIGGEQSAALERLVDGVIARLEPKAAAGETAESLSDGLRKVGSGVLAPQCLRLTAFRRPEPNPRAPGEGWSLRLEDGTATASALAGGAFSDPRALPLDAARLVRLADALGAARPESLPGNLYAKDYRELTLAVLNRGKNLTARAFAGLDPAKLGAQQARFDHVFAEIEALAKEVREHGPKAPPPAAVPAPRPDGEDER
jgi:hypothetical protein